MCLCGGPGFCLPGCKWSTPELRYAQRQAYVAEVMLTQVRQPEQRAYYETQLRQAEALIAETDQLLAA